MRKSVIPLLLILLMIAVAACGTVATPAPIDEENIDVTEEPEVEEHDEDIIEIDELGEEDPEFTEEPLPTVVPTVTPVAILETTEEVAVEITEEVDTEEILAELTEEAVEIEVEDVSVEVTEEIIETEEAVTTEEAIETEEVVADATEEAVVEATEEVVETEEAVVEATEEVVETEEAAAANATEEILAELTEEAVETEEAVAAEEESGEADFDAMIAEAIAVGDVENGQRIFNESYNTSVGPWICASCHSVDEAAIRLVGPPLWDLHERVATVRLEESGEPDPITYVHNSILMPQAYIVPGDAAGPYPENLMPTNYGEILTEQELNDVTAYILTLGNE